MAKTLQLRRYPTATLTNITGANGEIIINTTLKTVTVHDGSTVGGITLARSTDLANAVSNITFNSVQANAAFLQANAVYAQSNNYVWPTANAAYARANNSINANTGGTITGDLTVTGNLIISGTTTTVNTISVITTDSLISLANNNIYSDTLDIGFYGAANTGASVNYFGLARQAGSNNFLLFKGISQDPSTNTIPAGSATAANVATLIANVAAYSITSNSIVISGNTTSGNISVSNTFTSNIVTSNTLNVSSNIAAGNVNVTGAIYQNGVITPTLITMLTYNLAF
jgi:cytoskeletal protein CcmA (bactofilin family)